MSWIHAVSNKGLSWVLFWEKSGQGVMLSSQLHSVSRLWMHRNILYFHSPSLYVP